MTNQLSLKIEPIIQAEKPKSKIFFGWWMAAALFVILFTTIGHFFYSFPVFIGALQNEFGWSITQISFGVMIFAVVYGFSNPVVGVLINNIGTRKVMLISAIIASISNLGFAFMQQLWALYLVMAINGFAAVGITVLPAQTLLTNWFNIYRGRALALTFLGAGAGGFVIPQFCEYMIRIIDWRSVALFGSMMIWVFVIPLIAIFVRSKPSEMGYLPDGDFSSEDNNMEAIPPTGLSVKQAFSTREFWLLVSIFFLQITGISAVNFHFIPFIEKEVGFTSQQAVFYYSLGIGFSMVGRLIGGWLGDRFKPQLIMVLTGILIGTGPFILEMFLIRLGLRNVNLLLLYAVPYGIGLGMNVIIIPLLISRCFGELNFPKITGLISMSFAAGIVIGIPVAGYIFDSLGSYEIVIASAMFACILSALLALFIRPDYFKNEFVTK